MNIVISAHKCPECGRLAAWGDDSNKCCACQRKPFEIQAGEMTVAARKRYARVNRISWNNRQTIMVERIANHLWKASAVSVS